MGLSAKLGRFFGPWFTFAALSGLASGFVFGALFSGVCLIAAVLTMVNGVFDRNTLKTVSYIAKQFPDFALIVLLVKALGFVAGFFSALCTALVGGKAGMWWGWISSVGFVCLVYPFYIGSGCTPDLFTPFILTLAPLAALFSMDFVRVDSSRYAWEAPLRSYFRSSWLIAPPQISRFAALVLPLLAYGIWQLAVVTPTFLQHQSYVTRLGFWETWSNSRRYAYMVNRVPFPRRSYCQSNLKQIQLSVLQYVQDYDEYYPPKPTNASSGSSAVIQSYLRSTQFFQCPSEFIQYQGHDFASGEWTDYWFNARFYKHSAATPNSSSIMWGDGNTGSGEANSAYSIRNLPTGFAPATRHLGGGNYAFEDGHVKWLRPATISNKPLSASSPFSYSMLP